MRAALLLACVLFCGPAFAGSEKPPAAPASATLAKDDIIAQAREARASGDGARAVSLMQGLQLRHENDPEVLLHLGYALIADGQFEEAVGLYDMLTAMQPRNSLAFNAKAVAFDYAGNHVGAQEVYDKALRIDSTSHTIKNNLALSYILNNEPKKAVALLAPLAKQPEAPPALRQNLALAYALVGDEKKSREMNLRDLTPEQADENQKFYAYYKKLKQSQKEDALMTRALYAPQGEKAEE